MPNQEKYILNYIGDDGEFLHSIDEYAEDMLAGDLNMPAYMDDAFDLYHYRYPFHGSLWQRWAQYQDYHALLGELPKYQVKTFGWFARLTRHLDRPSDLITYIFWNGIVLVIALFMMMGVIVTIFNAVNMPDEKYLAEHRTEILDSSMNYRNCTILTNPANDMVAIYRLTPDEIVQIDTLGKPKSVDVYVPRSDDGWYQLAEYHDEVGVGIVRSDQLGNMLRCSGAGE